MAQLRVLLAKRCPYHTNPRPPTPPVPSFFLLPFKISRGSNTSVNHLGWTTGPKTGRMGWGGGSNCAKLWHGCRPSGPHAHLSGWPSIGPSWEGGPRAYFVYLYIVVDHGTNDLYRCFLGSCDTGVKGEEEKKRGGVIDRLLWVLCWFFGSIRLPACSFSMVFRLGVVCDIVGCLYVGCWNLVARLCIAMLHKWIEMEILIFGPRPTHWRWEARAFRPVIWTSPAV